MEINWWWILMIVAPLGPPGLLRLTIMAVEKWREWRGPKLSYASQDEVENFQPELRDLMDRIFGLDLHDCIITDESSLFDFEPEIPVADSLKKILETYGLTETEVRDLRLVAICGVIRGWATH
jgi:hypothetical protein